MRRILLVLTVAVLMAALAGATAVPAFAQDEPSLPGCGGINEAIERQDTREIGKPFEFPAEIPAEPEGPAPPLTIPCVGLEV